MRLSRSDRAEVFRELSSLLMRANTEAGVIKFYGAARDQALVRRVWYYFHFVLEAILDYTQKYYPKLEETGKPCSIHSKSKSQNAKRPAHAKTVKKRA